MEPIVFAYIQARQEFNARAQALVEALAQTQDPYWKGLTTPQDAYERWVLLENAKTRPLPEQWKLYGNILNSASKAVSTE